MTKNKVMILRKYNESHSGNTYSFVTKQSKKKWISTQLYVKTHF
jgi:hypothetical protein